MLQQTQTRRVIPKYKTFISAFPDFASLAKAPLRRILTVWQGLGYNRRALHLKKLARIVVKDFNGKLPAEPRILETLPGIGKATAASIAAFAFNKPTIFIETNIRTVFIHVFFDGQDVVDDGEILPLIERTLDRKNPRRWYNALMDYGVMLKEKNENPARRSAHYKRQSAFAGSDRQIRGRILKVITERQSTNETELVKTLNVERTRLRRLLRQLEKEGFIKKKQARFSLL
jgi:A/G-specific adenine glycosylase